MLFDDQDDDLKDPTDEDLQGDDNHEEHSIPTIGSVDDTLEDKEQFKDPVGSPSITGEENPLSGSATDGEPVDIDDHRKALGLDVDETDEIPKPLGED